MIGGRIWLRHEGEPTGSPIKERASLVWPIGHVRGDPGNRVAICEGVEVGVLDQNGNSFSEKDVLDGLTMAIHYVFDGDDYFQCLCAVFGIKQKSITKWYRDQVLPPPRILQWMGWACLKPKGFGKLWVAAAHLPPEIDLTDGDVYDRLLAAQRSVRLARS